MQEIRTRPSPAKKSWALANKLGLWSSASGGLIDLPGSDTAASKSTSNLRILFFGKPTTCRLHAFQHDATARDQAAYAASTHIFAFIPKLLSRDSMVQEVAMAMQAGPEARVDGFGTSIKVCRQCVVSLRRTQNRTPSFSRSSAQQNSFRNQPWDVLKRTQSQQMINWAWG